METYLVGGAVRDTLLDLPVKDRDWVVVGATPEDMLAKGFRQVGADFPVFLHPETNEEYALARTERKQGHGYHGFTVYSAPDVTLEDDLVRRDLTINAMAQTLDGEVIDPFHGQQDLTAKRLRHVSPAFAEDPLRILRTARFAARFAPLGFTVADETMTLMQQMVADGEVDHLVPERVWQEVQRALHEHAPTAFFDVLHDSGALSVLLPELADTSRFEAALTCLHCVATADAPTESRFAALLSPLPPEEAKTRADAMKAPNDCRDLATLVSQVITPIRHLPPSGDDLAEGFLQILEQADGWRRPERFGLLLGVLRCVPPEPSPRNLDRLASALSLTTSVDARELMARGHKGKALGAAIRAERLARIQSLIQQESNRDH